MERAGKFTNPFEKLKVASFFGFTLMVATLTIASPDPSWPVVSASRGPPALVVDVRGPTAPSLHAAAVAIRIESADSIVRRENIFVSIRLLVGSTGFCSVEPRPGVDSTRR